MIELKIMGKNLRRYRLFRGISQKELAAKVGLTAYTISNIELGKQKNVGTKYIISICRELNMEMTELFMKGINHIPLKLVISDEGMKTAERILSMIVERK